MQEEKNAWKWAEFKVSIVPIEEEEEEGKVVIKRETRQIKRMFGVYRYHCYDMRACRERVV